MIENKNNLENVVAPLTIRDHFAMAALQAMITRSNGYDPRKEEIGGDQEKLVIVSYEIADVMMEEREKKG